jgi:hypothetical protein
MCPIQFQTEFKKNTDIQNMDGQKFIQHNKQSHTAMSTVRGHGRLLREKLQRISCVQQRDMYLQLIALGHAVNDDMAHSLLTDVKWRM